MMMVVIAKRSVPSTRKSVITNRTVIAGTIAVNTRANMRRTLKIVTKRKSATSATVI
jgi:hypothetical protein